MKKVCTSLLLVALFLTSTLAQERPFRIGFKAGWPQIIGLNLEYVTPLLNKKLSADVDFARFSAGSFSYTVLALGPNYYFMKEGRGLYGGLGLGYMNFSADESISQNGETANASASLSITSLNLKLGGKHGGLLYFRWELGYMMAFGDNSLKLEGNSLNGVHVEKTLDLPFSSTPLLNIGIGFSF